VQRIRLDQYALKIQVPKQLLEDRPLMVLTGSVASLSDRDAQAAEYSVN